MAEQRKSRLLMVTMAVLITAAVLTGSIAVPILCRPFYYAHIKPLQISESSGLSENQIRETYNEVMDYCLGIMNEFELTYMPWSAEGASHFADVQKLFLLDIRIAAISIILLGSILIIGRYKQIRPAPLKGHTAGFWSAAGLGVICLVLSGFAAFDFDAAFIVFHNICFPGKDNWLFDPSEDPVINMLPQVFFRNCAMLAAILIILCCTVLILSDRHCRNQSEKNYNSIAAKSGIVTRLTSVEMLTMLEEYSPSTS